MIFIRSLIFNIIFFGWTIIIMLLGIPLLITLPAKVLVVTMGRFWAYPSIWFLKVIAGTKYEIRGLENLPSEPCIIASKHQSAWETMIFYRLVKCPTFILKKELLLLPVYGKYLKNMGSIVVDREAGASALKNMVKQSKHTLNEGRHVIIFPEGTRVKAGEKGICHPGISALYSRCDVPVVPVALTSGKFWAKNSFFKKPGTIIMEIMPALEAGLRRDQFMEKLESIIENKTNELLNE
jgi:1-acyl-sn-glycerol-3-phosphate acyltransferase